jgi:flavoprotein
VDNIAWAFTGAGHFLRESVELAGSVDGLEVDVFLSLAAVEVLAMYGLGDRLREVARGVTAEAGHSFPVTSKFSVGKYATLVIAPATGNTVAKCVHGIADSLVSCMFSQAGKSGVPICVLPTDISPEMESIAPNGNRVMVRPRPIDLELTERLAAMSGVDVVRSPGELRLWIKGALNK